MKAPLDPSDFDQLRNYVISLFPPNPAPSVVSAEDQANELSYIDKTIGSERFYFVVDMRTFGITQCGGVQRWMGYAEKEFTLKKYWGLVHPGLQQSVHTIFLELARTLCTGTFNLEFMVQRYSSKIALRHYKGHYLLLKRTASVFQYDKDNRLTEYLNEFTIIGPYNGESLSPSFFTDKGEQETQRGHLILKQAMDAFLRMSIFSPQELQVARIQAYQPGISRQEIATIMKVSPHTINTYYKRFLEKARDHFQVQFLTTLEAASYLREAGLL